MLPPATVKEWVRLYRTTLLNDVVPFWTRHAVDPESGAINNCLDDAGNLLSKDRYIWSQGRALWTFSALYNRVEHRPEWLDIARGLHRYLSSNGRDSKGRWMYRLDENGGVLERDISIYVDAFVMTGLSEYYVATRDAEAGQLAVQTFETTHDRLCNPGSYGIAPYVLPKGMKTLGIPMSFSFFYHNLGKALGRPDICRIGHEYALEVLKDFYAADKNAVMEFVALDGRAVDSPKGRVCIPGHVIEAMWFLVTVFEDTGDREFISECCRLIKRHVELGWDEEYGGIRLALDVDGNESVAWQKPDCKPWWVQVEALVATACAYVHTGESWCVDWHIRIRDYAFSHYPVPTGEWTQWLDRYGNKSETAALPVKDPFHLPRALLYLMDYLRVSEKTDA